MITPERREALLCAIKRMLDIYIGDDLKLPQNYSCEMSFVFRFDDTCSSGLALDRIALWPTGLSDRLAGLETYLTEMHQGIAALESNAKK